MRTRGESPDQTTAAGVSATPTVRVEPRFRLDAFGYEDVNVAVQRSGRA